MLFIIVTCWYRMPAIFTDKCESQKATPSPKIVYSLDKQPREEGVNEKEQESRTNEQFSSILTLLCCLFPILQGI